MNSRIVYSILFYILVMILLIISKPAIMFENNGEFRSFGVGSDKTMFSFGVFSVVLAIVSFYIFCLIDMIYV